MKSAGNLAVFVEGFPARDRIIDLDLGHGFLDRLATVAALEDRCSE